MQRPLLKLFPGVRKLVMRRRVAQWDRLRRKGTAGRVVAVLVAKVVGVAAEVAMVEEGAMALAEDQEGDLTEVGGGLAAGVVPMVVREAPMAVVAVSLEIVVVSPEIEGDNQVIVVGSRATEEVSRGEIEAGNQVIEGHSPVEIAEASRAATVAGLRGAAIVAADRVGEMVVEDEGGVRLLAATVAWRPPGECWALGKVGYRETLGYGWNDWQATKGGHHAAGGAVGVGAVGGRDDGHWDGDQSPFQDARCPPNQH